MSAHVLVATDRVDRFAPSLEHLRGSGARVTLVSPGAASVLAGTQLSHDLAVIDGDHPRGCGTVLLLSALPDLPRVVVMTDDPASPSIDRCLVAGAADVLTWNGAPDLLAEHILDASSGVPESRRRDVAVRRRQALARVAAVEAHRPVGHHIRLTDLERRAPRAAPIDLRTDGLRGLGSAQQHVAQGLKAGRSCTELARDADVTTSAIYQAKRRLARRVGVPEEQLVVWLQTVELPTTASASRQRSATSLRRRRDDHADASRVTVTVAPDAMDMRTARPPAASPSHVAINRTINLS